MSKKQIKRIGCISMRLHKKPITNPPTTFKLPPGCIGIIFAFKDEKSARKFDGADVEVTEIETMGVNNEKD